MVTTLYSFPTPSSMIISTLNLQPHPEGGHFAVTYVDEKQSPSPYATGQPRAVQSTIYYFLSIGHDVPDNGKSGAEKMKDHSSSKAKLHKNKSPTMHLLHSGRAVYTLIEANPKTGSKPQVKQVVMGEDVSKGETRQLMVDGNWWKVSELPEDDRQAAKEGKVDPEKVGCLISEVVAPGFDWHDHAFLEQFELEKLFGSDKDSIERYSQYLTHP